MQAAYGVPLASPAAVRSDATGEGIISWCGAARLTYNILAWMAVVTYSLLTLALIKISKVGGSQQFADGLDGSPTRICTSMQQAVWRLPMSTLIPLSTSMELSTTCQTQQHMRGGRSVPVWNGGSHSSGRPKWNISM